MVKWAIPEVVEGLVEDVKCKLKQGAFVKVEEYVSLLNTLLGINYFNNITLNKVYCVSGCGTLIEFVDSENSITIISDVEGNIISCKVSSDGFVSHCLENKFSCCKIPNYLVMEGSY